MHRFTNILFINDPPSNSNQIFREAIKLAQKNNAKLTIASILVELPKPMGQLEKTFWDIQDKQLDSLLDELHLDGLEITKRDLMGDPSLQIMKEVIASEHDLVIKPAEGNDSVTSILFGSTDIRLIRKCPCPVWIMKPTRKKKLDRILVAINSDPSKKKNTELNKSILEISASLANQEESELHIIHVWSLENEATLRSGLANTSDTENNLLDQNAHDIHKEWQENLLNEFDFGNLTVKPHLVEGDPLEMIPQIAEKENVDLLIMGTEVCTGISVLFKANTAEKMFSKVDCSVFAIKPIAYPIPT